MRKNKLLVFFTLSILFHLSMVLLLAFSNRFMSPPPPKHEAVSVEFIDPKQIAELTKSKIQKRYEEKLKQIVEQDENSLNNEKPLKDAYLSAKNQRVEKETSARERGDFKNSKTKNAISGSKQKGAKEAKAEANKKPTMADLMGTSPSALLQKKDSYEKTKETTGNQSNRNAGGDVSQNSDYLKNVEEGAETMLNTREFKYYTYYTRIRRQLSQYWEPRVKDRLAKMFNQGRRIATDQDHITKLLIVLNDSGELVRVQVLSESGVRDLDDAATDAFRSAAPFPNPPKGIVESDGTVKIRWDFVLES